MAIEDVNNPKTLTTIDPKVAGEKKEGDKAYWQQKAEEARARHDYMEYQRAIEMMGSSSTQPQFQIKGSVDLGNFNPQEALKEERTRGDAALKDKDQKIEEERKRADELEKKLQDEKLNTIRQEFAGQMAELNKTIQKLAEANAGDAKNIYTQFMDQYKGALEVAKSFGFEKTTAGGNPSVELEIKKMEFDNAQKDREFQWKMKQDDKTWELEKLKLQDEHNYRQAQLAADAKKTDMLANLPQTIGGVLVKGIMDRSQTESQITQDSPGYYIALGEGEVGTVPCPHCKTAIGVAPDQTTAQCIGCKTTYPVKRTPKAQGPPAEANHININPGGEQPGNDEEEE